MGKKLPDFIHYYIGCRCLRTDLESTGYQWILSAFDCDETAREPYYIKSDNQWIWVSSIKPILRRLDSITEEECENYNHIKVIMHSINKAQDQMKTDAAATHYLLKQGFDLFGLLDAGLGIDEKELTSTDGKYC